MFSRFHLFQFRPGVGFLVILLGGARADAGIPALEVPSLATMSANETFTFVAPGWRVAVGESFVDGDSVSISAAAGQVSLSGTSGLTFTQGDGTGDASMEFSGSRSDINAALAGMTFDPPGGFAGEAVLTFSVTGVELVEETVKVVVNGVIDAEAARDMLLDGVTSIHSGVQPGYLIAFGEQAYDVALYPNVTAEAMIAVAGFGAGRVLAVPDHQMLNMGSYGAQSGNFYRNAIEWTSGDAGLDLAIVTYNAGTAAWLAGEGYTNVTTTDEAGLVAALAGADLFIGGWLGNSEAPENLQALRDFALAGGGLMIAEYGTGYEWWWEKDLPEAPGNLLLREAGIGFSERYPLGYTGTVSVANRAAGQVNAETVLEIIAGVPGYSESDTTRAFWVLSQFATVLPPDDPLQKQVEFVGSMRLSTITATPQTPVSDAQEKALLNWESSLLLQKDPAQIGAHRSADALFGTIPPAAPRVGRTVTIDPSLGRWHSTGLYAAPGEVVTVKIPAALSGAGIKVRVNGCTDNISGRDIWLRSPVVSRLYDIDSDTVPVANAFGGAIYVDLGNAAPGGAPFAVTFSNAVEAPFFVLGENTNQEWIDTLRDLPAPFAELVCDRLALALPSSMIRDLENPVELMTFWKGVVDRMDYVGGFEHLRNEGERIQIDVQISAGYLHSGYPMMGPFMAGPELVDLAYLTGTGSWGWFHELGHEMQRRPDKSWSYYNPYTWDGQVEVTVNIFANAALEYASVDPPVSGHQFSAHPLEVARRAIASVAAGTSLSDRDPYPLYYQLSDLFGWEGYRAVFQSYHDDALNDPGALPANDQEKKDQWLLRWSRVTGHDLRSYLVDHWGLDVSANALQETANLGHQPYLPAWGELETVSATTNHVDIDLDGSILDYDGGSTVVEVTSPAKGTLTAGAGGVWHYQATPGTYGLDTFEYIVESSTGHRFATPVTVALEVPVPAVQDRVLAEIWYGPAGATVGELPGDPDFPDSPDVAYHLDDFDTGENLAEDYGARLRAYLTPPVSGTYTFWVAGDDSFELWLSTDSEPANASRIAFSDAWTSHHEWERYASQMSVPIDLVAGRVYYIEARVREGGGGDHLSVAWAGPTISRQVIRGHYLQPFGGTGAPSSLKGLALWRYAGGALPSTTPLAEDSNGDGVDDGLAYFYGAPSPAYDARTLAPAATLETIEGKEYYRVAYRRDSTVGDLAGRLQYSDQVGAWVDATDGVDGVIVQTVTDAYGAGIDEVINWIPTAGLDRLFTRLAASEGP